MKGSRLIWDQVWCRLPLLNFCRAGGTSNLKVGEQLQIFIRDFQNRWRFVSNRTAFFFYNAIVHCKDIFFFFLFLRFNISLHVTGFLELRYFLSQKHGSVAGFTLGLFLSRHKWGRSSEEISGKQLTFLNIRRLIIPGIAKL